MERRSRGSRGGNILPKRYLSSSHLLPAYFDSEFIQNSPHFRIDKIEGKGRGFVATTDIAAGTVLFMEKPIVSFSESHLPLRVDGRLLSKLFLQNLFGLQNTKNINTAARSA